VALDSFGIAFPGQGAKPEAITAALRRHREHPAVGMLLRHFRVQDPAGLDFLDTAVSQPATYAVGIAAVHTAFGTEPGELSAPVVVGHSLGELTAAACAGVIGVESGFRLAVRRGALCREQNERRPGAMVAVVGTELDDIEWLRRRALGVSGGILEIAGVNSRRQAVLSGDAEAVATAVRLAEEERLRAEVLPIGGAFHCPVMLDVIPAWRSAVESVAFERPRVPFVSSVDAQVHDEPAEIRELLIRALLLPVRWRDAVRTVAELGVPGLADTGPGDALLKLGRREKLLEFAGLGSV
jgi:[acyl-carrier-protein] S-malonyltransferase